MTDIRPRCTLATVLFIAAFFSVWSIRATWLYSIDAAIAADGWRAVYSSLVKFLLWVVPAWGFAAWVRRVPPWCRQT